MKHFSRALLAALAGWLFVQAAAAAEAVKFTDGEYPSGVIEVNNMLYGTTSGGGSFGCLQSAGCGTVFSIDLATGAERVIYAFCRKVKCTDAWSPNRDLVYVNGTLYGDSFGGGTSIYGTPYGTVFAVDPKTGAEKLLYSFCQQDNCADGGFPTSLMNLKGTLYGTTNQGGMGTFYYSGVVFALDRKTGAETLVYSFCGHEGCTDGAEPAAPVINVKGMLYGTTLVGGYAACSSNDPPGCGTVYSLDPKTGMETALYDFCSQPHCTDGQTPESGVISIDGLLYGTTYGGGVAGCSGNFGCGTVYSVDPATGTETVLHAFCSQANCADGAEPFSGLTAVGGTLYGTTNQGGLGYGTVFSVDPTTGAENVLYSFCSEADCADGATPSSGLIGVGGLLYGTTSNGGTGCNGFGCGTVYSINPATGTETVVYAFCSQLTCT